MIEGVKIKKLSVHEDERGRLMEILRADDDIFVQFGQVYITTAKPGFVKGWHFHKKQIDIKFIESFISSGDTKDGIPVFLSKWAKEVVKLLLKNKLLLQ